MSDGKDNDDDKIEEIEEIDFSGIDLENLDRDELVERFKDREHTFRDLVDINRRYSGGIGREISRLDGMLKSPGIADALKTHGRLSDLGGISEIKRLQREMEERRLQFSSISSLRDIKEQRERVREFKERLEDRGLPPDFSQRVAGTEDIPIPPRFAKPSGESINTWGVALAHFLHTSPHEGSFEDSLAESLSYARERTSDIMAKSRKG